jgi:signal transduction histidine kinase
LEILRSGKSNEKKEKINLSNFLEGKTKFFQKMAQEKEIKIENEIEKNIFIEASLLDLEVLVNNLIKNAIEHNFKNG